MRFWLGTALLAGSWLFGVGYYHPANAWVWLAAVVAAVLVLGDWTHGRLPAPADGASPCVRRAGTVPILARTMRSMVARMGLSPLLPPSPSFGLGEIPPWRRIAVILTLLPAVWFVPWPYRAGPLLFSAGVALQMLPTPETRFLPRLLRDLAHGAVVAGVGLLVQTVALEFYIARTARSHELPAPFPRLLAGIARLLGIGAVADGSNLVMQCRGQAIRLGATWELLLDPATFCFIAGSAAVLFLDAWQSQSRGGRGVRWLGGLGKLALVLIAWVPLRAGLMMAVYVYRVRCSDAAHPPHAMDHFFSPWVLLALLLPPALAAWLACSPRRRGSDAMQYPGPVRRRNLPLWIAAALAAVAAALFTAAVGWDPIGPRKEGRVMVIERHSQWEPTTKPYDTSWFVEPTLYGEGSGYNYAAIYDYLAQYYDMSRLLESDKIDDRTLSRCDVLVLKLPTERYLPDEVQAVQRFVARGGGLLLIGDHTDLFHSATTMNDIARPMGFTFRDDALLSFGDSPYEQRYVKPLAPHPIIEDLPPMDFALTCSIDPGTSRGRPVIVSTGLWSMGPDYRQINFLPELWHCPEMRYGAFIQAWAARYGDGRAAAFADSTLFSNFCVFQPGHAEIMLGMVEWLNHANPPCDPRPWLVVLGLLPLGTGLWLARGRCGAGLLLVAAGTFGWLAATLAVNLAHQRAMPQPECIRPQTRVVVDRTTCTVPLSKGGYTQGDGIGYGLFEQWIARLGCYTVRQEGEQAFSGDVLVILCPSKPATAAFRQRLEHYVATGGRLLVVDSPENEASTAASLLAPFDLTVRHNRPCQGTLALPGLSNVAVEKAFAIEGGKPLARIGNEAVAAAVQHGDGTVMAIGCGSLWSDKRMGDPWVGEPAPEEKARYAVLFHFLRAAIEGPAPENEP